MELSSNNETSIIMEGEAELIEPTALTQLTTPIIDHRNYQQREFEFYLSKYRDLTKISDLKTRFNVKERRTIRKILLDQQNRRQHLHTQAFRTFIPKFQTEPKIDNMSDQEKRDLSENLKTNLNTLLELSPSSAVKLIQMNMSRVKLMKSALKEDPTKEGKKGPKLSIFVERTISTQTDNFKMSFLCSKKIMPSLGNLMPKI